MVTGDLKWEYHKTLSDGLKSCNRKLIRCMVALFIFIAFGILLYEAPKTESTNACSEVEKGIPIPYLKLKIPRYILGAFLPMIISILYVKANILTTWRLIYDDAIERSFDKLEEDPNVEFQEYERELSAQCYRAWTFPVWLLQKDCLHGKIIHIAGITTIVILIAGPPIASVYLMVKMYSLCGILLSTIVTVLSSLVLVYALMPARFIFREGDLLPNTAIPPTIKTPQED